MAYPILSFVHCFQIGLEFGNVVFVEGGKPETTEKNLQGQSDKQQQTQPSYDDGSGIWTGATLVEGERFHHFTIPAPLNHLSNNQLVSDINIQIIFACLWTFPS